MATAYEYIASNSRRIFLLVTAFTAVTLACVWWLAYGFGMAHYSRPPDGSDSYGDYMYKRAAHNIMQQLTDYGAPSSQEPLEWVEASVPSLARSFAWRAVLVVALVMILLAFSPLDIMETMVLNSAHALRLKEEDHRELYRLAGTVFMTAGLPMPRLYVVEDDSLNAFTTGFSPRSACVVLTRGMLDKLSRPELEAVLAHEAAHAVSGDCRMMLVAVSSVLLFKFLSECFFVGVFYGARKNIFSAVMFFVCGALSAVLGFVLAPLGRLAVSRACEFRADALGAKICRNPGALASALKKISEDSRVELLDRHPSMVGMCIVNPRKETNFFLAVTGLWNAHPPISARIHALNDMDGRV